MCFVSSPSYPKPSPVPTLVDSSTSTATEAGLDRKERLRRAAASGLNWYTTNKTGGSLGTPAAGV